MKGQEARFILYDMAKKTDFFKSSSHTKEMASLIVHIHIYSIPVNSINGSFADKHIYTYIYCRATERK